MDETEKSIDEVHNEIEKMQAQGVEHESFAGIKQQIQLVKANPEPEHQQTLKEHLEESIFHFDTEHHELLMKMEWAISVLSNSGV